MVTDGVGRVVCTIKLTVVHKQVKVQNHAVPNMKTRREKKMARDRERETTLPCLTAATLLPYPSLPRYDVETKPPNLLTH